MRCRDLKLLSAGSRNGRDEAVLVLSLAKDLSKRGYVNREILLFDDLSVPRAVKQITFRHYLAMALNESKKHIDRLRLQFHIDA